MEDRLVNREKMGRLVVIEDFKGRLDTCRSKKMLVHAGADPEAGGRMRPHADARFPSNIRFSTSTQDD
jgi:hypothetical protein